MQFVVIYGFMPALGTMFDHKCKPLYNYVSDSGSQALFICPKFPKEK